MNALLFERPVWFASGPLILEEEAQEMEDFTYHRPVLAAEVMELLAPRPSSLVVDATCGGGGHTEATSNMRAIHWPASAGGSHCGTRIFATRTKFSTSSASQQSVVRFSIVASRRG